MIFNYFHYIIHVILSEFNLIELTNIIFFFNNEKKSNLYLEFLLLNNNF